MAQTDLGHPSTSFVLCLSTLTYRRLWVRVAVPWLKISSDVSKWGKLTYRVFHVLDEHYIVCYIIGWWWKLFNNLMYLPLLLSRTTDTQWKHKSKISEKLGRCGRQNMLWPYLKIWDWEWIFGRAVKAISSLGVRSPWLLSCNLTILLALCIDSHVCVYCIGSETI